MSKLLNTFLFGAGIVLTLFGLLITILLIVSTVEGFETENAKLGAVVIGFLMSPVTLCGIYLIVNHRFKRNTKRIKITRILKVVHEKNYRLTIVDLVTKLNVTTDEAKLIIKELEKIGSGRLGKDRYGRIEFVFDKTAGFKRKSGKVALFQGIFAFIKSTGYLRIFVCIFFIIASLVALLFGINECCGPGFYYLIFFSLLSGLSTAYIVWYHNNNRKNKSTKFVEIKGSL